MLRSALIVLSLAAAACHGHHSPTEPVGPHGTLSGTVTIGPNCPNENPANPCPPPPGAFDARKVLVYDAARTRLIATVDIEVSGFYRIDLPPASYVVDLLKAGIDRSADVPATVTIVAGQAVTLDIHIDTGIR